MRPALPIRPVPSLRTRPSPRVLARAGVVAALVGSALLPSGPASAGSRSPLAAVRAAAPDVSAPSAARVERPRASRSRRGALVAVRSRLSPPDRAALPVSVATPVLAPVRQTERLPIAFRTVRRQDASRLRGTEAVVRRGRTGVLERSYLVVGLAGTEVSRTRIDERRTREPVTQVVAVGTRVPPPPPASARGGLHWDRLAQCESGGDPHAVSSGGTYRGLYQFSFSTWRGVGGTGDPAQASPDEQTARASRLYQRDGRAPWPVCGRYL